MSRCDEALTGTQPEMSSLDVIGSLSHVILFLLITSSSLVLMDFSVRPQQRYPGNHSEFGLLTEPYAHDLDMRENI